MPEPVLETFRLHMRYGRKVAVEDLSLTVRRGEIFGYLGPNGAGKTTALKMLLGLVRPTAGTGRVLGARLGDRRVRARLGFLPEHFRFQDWLTGRELLRFHGRLVGRRGAALEARCEELLGRVDLLDASHRPIRTYSKGMTQRLGLAQALLNEPEIVFLDEPTSGLDPVGRVLVRDIIRDLRARGVTVFLNSHLLGEVEATCTRVVFVKEGRAVHDMPLEGTERALDVEVRSAPLGADAREALERIPDEVLWAARLGLKRDLLRFVQERARHRWAADRVEPGQAIAFGAFLDDDVFTIGFARRFATYKRADLLFRDPERLQRILYDRRRPVQIIFAGKAHPADEAGKALLQKIYRAARDPAFAGRIAIVEGYDMHVARWLVQGVDLWLNNPRAPFEACGTSGMKAGLNGVPSLSIRDGWWVEGHGHGNGWDFGGDDDMGADHEAQDARDAESLYTLLEKTVVPLYYARGRGGIPTSWLRVVRRAIQTVTPHFSTRRMMKQYVSALYREALGAPRETGGPSPREARI